MNWEYLAQLPIIALGVMAGNLLAKHVIDEMNRREWRRFEEKARVEAARLAEWAEKTQAEMRKRAN